MKKVIILRYGELHLKGKNRYVFENILIADIKEKLKTFSCQVKKNWGRYIVSEFEPECTKQIVNILSKIFGLHSLSEADEIETSEDNILGYCKNILLSQKSFRASVNRADKRFAIGSEQFARMVGAAVYNNNPGIKVDLKHYEVEVMVDIRENGKTYISTTKVMGAGGMPYGSAGKGLVLLSGGIDSPVSAYMVAKRGLALDALHFHSFPHTSLEAKQKVVSLAKQIKPHMGNFKLYVCNFTQIQEAIYKNCRSDYQITIMRRIMLRIADRLCQSNKLSAIVTGESLGQVASQTVQSLTCTNAVLQNVPALRPLIGFDKSEIVDIAVKIGTYDISILPYEDCCTVFLPKKPVIKPTIKQCEREEGMFDFEPLIAVALETLEVIDINAN